MIVLGIIFSAFGIGFFCWLLFTLAVYALPFFAGLSAGLAAFHTGAGVIGALIVGVLAGAATLVIGQIVFAVVRTPLIRAGIGLLYAVPAAIAGYHATLGLAHIGMPSEVWREAHRHRRRCLCRRHRLGADVSVPSSRCRAGRCSCVELSGSLRRAGFGYPVKTAITEEAKLGRIDLDVLFTRPTRNGRPEDDRGKHR